MIARRHIKQNGKVDLWDLGPARPKAPEAPKAPDLEKIKDAGERALAEVEHEDAIERYKNALRAFGAAKKHHAAWHEEKGGPVKVEQWAVDARHSLTIEPDRYKLDLPKGAKPGTAQIEADEREAEEKEALERARENDPQFGQRSSGAAA